MTEPTGTSGWPQTPGAWRVAQACEDAAQRFERAMRDLVAMDPSMDAETRAQIAKGLLQMQQDLGPFLQPDYVAAPVNDGPVTLMRREGGT